MTAHELAKQLLALPDVMVTVRGYEGGVNEVTVVDTPKPIILNHYSEWYYGKHEFWDNEDIPKPETVSIFIG